MYIERHIINNDGALMVILITKGKDMQLICDDVQLLEKNTYRYTLNGSAALDYLMTHPSQLSAVDKMYMETSGHILPFKYTLCDPLGTPPTRARPSDSGFDLSLVAIRNTFGNVILYGTGVTVQPPSGFYFDLVPRSSMIKQGYMLANSVGIIDQSYTGEIMVPLIKVDPDAPDPILPCRMVQLIPRKWYGFIPEQVDSLDITERASGGFGSTN